MTIQTILLIVIGIVLLIAAVLLLGGSGMAMMAGMMGTPIGWIALLIIVALGGVLAYAVLYAH